MSSKSGEIQYSRAAFEVDNEENPIRNRAGGEPRGRENAESRVGRSLGERGEDQAPISAAILRTSSTAESTRSTVRFASLAVRSFNQNLHLLAHHGSALSQGNLVLKFHQGFQTLFLHRLRDGIGKSGSGRSLFGGIFEDSKVVELNLLHKL